MIPSPPARASIHLRRAARSAYVALCRSFFGHAPAQRVRAKNAARVIRGITSRETPYRADRAVAALADGDRLELTAARILMITRGRLGCVPRIAWSAV